MSREGMEQGDIGWSGLPERSYVSKRVREVLREAPGIEITTLQVWNQLDSMTRRTIAESYGSAADGRKAVHKSLMNLKGLHGNPKKVRGTGDANTVWLYTGPRELRLPKGEIVHTTETPHVDETREEKFRDYTKEEGFVDYDIRMPPIDETPPPLSRPKVEPDPLGRGPQVGDTKEFVIVGKLSDGSFLWRREDDGTLGFIEFNVL